tara:strand:- start:720 stop:899 length:180 start_codon:yes stop_codon:yes gene_type:complete
MFKFLLIIFIIIYVIYKVSTFFIKTFIGQTLKRSKKNTKTKNKGILDEEGDFIDYEEVD